MPEDSPWRPKTTREPQALSTEYHKARKQLLLWTAILLAWEFVGVDLAKAQAAGGNVGAIISAIKSPQAVPWILIILIAYFIFKTTIEWYQSSLSRRTSKVSRADFISALLLAVLTYSLYAYQRIKQVQLADALTYSGIYSFFLGAVLGWVIGSSGFYAVLWVIARRRGIRFVAQTWRWFWLRFLLAISLFAIYPFARLFGLPVRPSIILVACVLIGVVSAAMSFMNWLVLRAEDPPHTNVY